MYGKCRKKPTGIHEWTHRELSCNGCAKIGAAETRSECIKNIGSNLVSVAFFQPRSQGLSSYRFIDLAPGGGKIGWSFPYVGVLDREMAVETSSRKKEPTWSYWGPVGRGTQVLAAGREALSAHSKHMGNVSRDPSGTIGESI